ncbi:right-handed parallel beta-helix repeat-containing protein [Methanobrevibacter sp. OttesenSCG-928-K11]|nr:right-handed parallel beta-helix repeat-containing protein [Methanobrevibacter sp. OttesenSCG-928-K11]
MKFIKKIILLLFLFLVVLGTINFVSAESVDNTSSTDKINTSISGSDTYIIESGNSFNISLLDSKGNVLSNQSIIISINGKDYEKITDEKGCSFLDINLNKGNYLIDISFIGNDDYKGSTANYKVFVRDVPTVFIPEGLTNDEIQIILNSVKENSLIEFLGDRYDGIHLTIDKPLNLITNIGTTLNGVSSDSVLKFFSVSSGKIAGFNICNGLNGIGLINSKNILIEDNFISHNYYGIKLLETENVLIQNNEISYNQEGIYFDKNTIKSIITHNLFTHNEIGINTQNEGFFIVIHKNNFISNNFTDINLNSIIHGLNISGNLFSESRIGLNYGLNYRIIPEENHIVEYNVFTNNIDFAILARESIYNTIEIGPNDVRNNDYRFAPVCERIRFLFFIMPEVSEDKTAVIFPGGSNLPDSYFSVRINDVNYNLNVINGIIEIPSGLTGDLTMEVTVGDKTYYYTIYVDSSTNNGGDETSENTNNQENNNPQTNSTTIHEGSGSESNTGTSSSSKTGEVGTNNIINAETPDSQSSANSASASSQSASSSSSVEKSAVKKISIDDEFFRVLGIGTLIALLILSIGGYYINDIKAMFNKRREKL